LWSNAVEAAVPETAIQQLRRHLMQRRCLINRVDQNVTIQEHRHALLAINFAPRKRLADCAVHGSQRVWAPAAALAVLPWLHGVRKGLHLLITIIPINSARLSLRVHCQHQRTALFRSSHDSASDLARHAWNRFVRHTASSSDVIIGELSLKEKTYIYSPSELSIRSIGFK
jgi:hypothetical protein